MRALDAPAKINLALVVGPRRPDGKHEIVTLYQQIDLVDRVSLSPGIELLVEGFPGDSLVEGALRAVAARGDVEPHWHVVIEKRIPVAAGLGGGSSDAAAALRLASETLDRPLSEQVLRELAAGLGADVPFFLSRGPHLGEGDGTLLTPVELPQDYVVVLLLPHGVRKASTAAVYEAFDRRVAEPGFEHRRADLLRALSDVQRPQDLATLPRNDLTSSPLADVMERLGAFRADVSGAGPTVYGLFEHEHRAEAAAAEVRALGQVWIARPTWYG